MWSIDEAVIGQTSKFGCPSVMRVLCGQSELESRAVLVVSRGPQLSSMRSNN